MNQVMEQIRYSNFKLGNLCWLKNGKHFTCLAIRLYKLSMIIAFVRQSSQTSALEKKGQTASSRNESWRKNVVGTSPVTKEVLHIKLRVAKKALDKESQCFRDICKAFSGLSQEKLKP